MKFASALVGALLLWPTWAAASCQSKDAEQVVQVLGRGIDLNERFKRSVSAGDEVAYAALRRQNERYSEETALPCVYRAVAILDEALNEALLLKLMEYAVSRQNSADETVSEALAVAFSRYPDAVATGVRSFAPARTRMLLRKIESGWPGVSKTLEPAVREKLESQVKSMRAELAKRISAQ